MARETLVQAKARADKAEKDLADFKVKVRDVAMEYAEDNGWCSEVERALEEVGIKPTPKSATVTIEVADLRPLFARWDYEVNRDNSDNENDLRDKVTELLTGYNVSGVEVSAEVIDA